MSVDLYQVFSDGGCAPTNPGPGGYAALVRSMRGDREVAGGEKHTTNNRMELRAVIEALRSIPGDSLVHVTTDSTYVKNGYTLWMPRWKMNGWRNNRREPVKNDDLWRALDVEVLRHTDVVWKWIKGHAGHAENERVHLLVEAARAAL